MGYFHPIYRDKHTVLPGVGTIHSHGVGSCAHTTGFDHYFLPEGAEKQIAGNVRFSTFIEEDGSLAWRFVHAIGPISRKRDWREPRLDEETQLDYPPAVLAEMRRLSETLHERDPVAWFFQTIGALDMELDSRLRKEDDLVRTVQHLTELLANPQEPTKHFVSAEECGLDKGFFRTASPEEREARRDLWRTNLSRAQTRLTALRSNQGERVALLRRLRSSMTGWSKRTGANKSANPFDIYQAALVVTAEAA